MRKSVLFFMVLFSFFIFSCNQSLAFRDLSFTLENNVQEAFRAATTAETVTIEASLSGDYTATTALETNVSSISSTEITFSSVPIGSEITVTVQILDSDSYILYEGSSSSFIVKSGKNEIALELSKLLNTSILLYSANKSEDTYTFTLETNSFSIPSYSESVPDFAFDADGTLYIAACEDLITLYRYSSGDGEATEISSSDESLQITTGLLASDYATNTLWIACYYALYKLSITETSDGLTYSATVYNMTPTDDLDETLYGFSIYNNIAYLLFKSYTSDEFSYYLAQYDLSNVSVDDSNPEQYAFTIENSDLKKISPDISVSYNAEITDMLYQDGAIYILVRDVLDDPDDNTQICNIYSRGAVIKYDVTSSSTDIIGWTSSSLDTSGKYVYGFYYDQSDNSYYHLLTGAETESKTQDDTEYWAKISTEETIHNYSETTFSKIYTPSNALSGFYGPEKIIAIKPKKLVIADDGTAFYTDSNGAYCYKNINRIVIVDLETFALSQKTVSENFTHENESNPMIGNAFYAEAGTFGSVWKTGESAGSAYTEDVILGFPLGE